MKDIMSVDFLPFVLPFSLFTSSFYSSLPDLPCLSVLFFHPLSISSSFLFSFHTSTFHSSLHMRIFYLLSSSGFCSIFSFLLHCFLFSPFSFLTFAFYFSVHTSIFYISCCGFMFLLLLFITPSFLSFLFSLTSLSLFILPVRMSIFPSSFYLPIFPSFLYPVYSSILSSFAYISSVYPSFLLNPSILNFSFPSIHPSSLLIPSFISSFLSFELLTTGGRPKEMRK